MNLSSKWSGMEGSSGPSAGRAGGSRSNRPSKGSIHLANPAPGENGSTPGSVTPHESRGENTVGGLVKTPVRDRDARIYVLQPTFKIHDERAMPWQK